MNEESKMIHISPIITRNFPKEVFKDFLRPYKLCSQFVNSGKEIHHFLQEQLNEKYYTCTRTRRISI